MGPVAVLLTVAALALTSSLTFATEDGLQIVGSGRGADRTLRGQPRSGKQNRAKNGQGKKGGGGGDGDSDGAVQAGLGEVDALATGPEVQTVVTTLGSPPPPPSTTTEKETEPPPSSTTNTPQERPCRGPNCKCTPMNVVQSIDVAEVKCHSLDECEVDSDCASPVDGVEYSCFPHDVCPTPWELCEAVGGSCESCVQDGCAFLGGSSCIPDCALIAEAPDCYSTSGRQFQGMDAAEICRLQRLHRIDDKTCRDASIDCGSCVGTPLVSEAAGTCRWVTDFEGIGGFCTRHQGTMMGPGLETCESITTPVPATVDPFELCHAVSESCTSCIEAGCAYFGYELCAPDCGSIADATDCYSSSEGKFHGLDVSDICEVEDLHRADDDLCHSKQGRCLDCVVTPIQSEQGGTCQWVSDDNGGGLCVRVSPPMMGEGSNVCPLPLCTGPNCKCAPLGVTLSTEQVEAECHGWDNCSTNLDCSAEGTTKFGCMPHMSCPFPTVELEVAQVVDCPSISNCTDCLLAYNDGCKWSVGSCHVMCPMDVSCFNLGRYDLAATSPQAKATELCVADDLARRDSNLCSSQTSCASCIGSIKSNNNPCSWFAGAGFCSSEPSPLFVNEVAVTECPQMTSQGVSSEAITFEPATGHHP